MEDTSKCCAAVEDVNVDVNNENISKLTHISRPVTYRSISSFTFSSSYLRDSNPLIGGV